MQQSARVGQRLEQSQIRAMLRRSQREQSSQLQFYDRLDALELRRFATIEDAITAERIHLTPLIRP